MEPKLFSWSFENEHIVYPEEEQIKEEKNDTIYIDLIRSWKSIKQDTDEE